MENARDLRRLAEWYQAFAEVGRSEEREGRLKLAEYLERRAAQLEERDEFQLCSTIAIEPTLT
jgi:hypothetical protein